MFELGEPEHINEAGVKWWKYKVLTDYAQKPNMSGICLPDVTAWELEELNGRRTIVLVKGGDFILYESQSLEAVGAKIDWIKIGMAFDRREKE